MVGWWGVFVWSGFPGFEGGFEFRVDCVGYEVRFDPWREEVAPGFKEF